MGWNDHMDDSELSNLPPEAYANPLDTDGPFEPCDTWLEGADRDDQAIAVREWFLHRYCDPGVATPYNGQEGGYLYVHGGPYDPAEEIPSRFSGIVPDDVIDEIVEEMHEEHGEQWAPVQHPDPRDEEWLDPYPAGPEDPLENLRSRIREYHQLLSLQPNFKAKNLCQILVYSAAIGALETFFWETVSYWADHDEKVQNNIISGVESLCNKKISLGELASTNQSPKGHVKDYLRNLVWHQIDKVVPLFEKGLQIKMPSVRFFKEALKKRHDIVHRSGQDENRNPTTVEPAELEQLLSDILACAQAINASLPPDKPLYPESKC